MKCLFITIATAMFGYCSFAQTNTFPSSGNVGIGTTSPGMPLDIQGYTSGSFFHVKNNIGSGYSSTLIYGQMTQGDSPNYDLVGLYNNNNTIKYQIRGDGQVYMSGNVGIGTTSPILPLQVNGTIYSATPISSTATVGATLAGDATYNFLGYEGYWGLRTSTNMSYNLDTYNGGTPLTAMTVLQGGNIGIGTTDPQGYKLAVNGSTIAESVTVKMHTNWPDYVFKSTYRLPSLAAVKAYIDQNQHLPEMPSETEVAKEGINLGEMNKLLTKKVEELTLYLIEKDKQVGQLQNQIKQLKTEQETRMAKLEAALTKLTVNK